MTNATPKAMTAIPNKMTDASSTPNFNLIAMQKPHYNGYDFLND